MGIFGPSQKDVWSEAASRIGAEYVGKTLKNPARIEKEHDNWKIVMDTYVVSTGKSTVTYTRVQAPFIWENDVIFKVSRKNIFSNLFGMFKMPAVETYDYDFNDSYIIRGNDEPVIRSIFENEKIRGLIQKTQKGVIQVKKYKRAKDDERVLYYQLGGILKDIDKIAHLFELFCKMLDTLVETGVASKKQPEMIL